MRYPNIAAERARRCMSLDVLAQKLGVTRKTLYNWEQNGHIPQSSLEKMANLFDVSVDYLLDSRANVATDFLRGGEGGWSDI